MQRAEHLVEKARGFGAGQAHSHVELPCGNEQRRSGGKGHHDRMRDEIDQIAQPRQPHAQLDKTAQERHAENIGHARFFGHGADQFAAHADGGEGGENNHGDGVGGASGHKAG